MASVCVYIQRLIHFLNRDVDFGKQRNQKHADKTEMTEKGEEMSIPK